MVMEMGQGRAQRPPLVLLAGHLRGRAGERESERERGGGSRGRVIVGAPRACAAPPNRCRAAVYGAVEQDRRGAVSCDA